MKRTIIRAMLLTTLSAGILSLSPAMLAQGDGACSNASVAGKWGVTTNGTVVGIGTRASLGIFTLDGAGSLLNGKATGNLNGSITEERPRAARDVHLRRSAQRRCPRHRYHRPSEETVPPKQQYAMSH